jgi:hypothetical protein
MFPSASFPYISKLKDKIDVSRKEINELEQKKQDFLKDNKKILELLQEYVANKPFLETLENIKERLAEGRIRELEEELENERRSNDLEVQNTWSVFETALEKAKIEMSPRVEIPHFMNMIKDVFKHPERYRGSINRMTSMMGTRRYTRRKPISQQKLTKFK